MGTFKTIGQLTQASDSQVAGYVQDPSSETGSALYATIGTVGGAQFPPKRAQIIFDGDSQFAGLHTYPNAWNMVSQAARTFGRNVDWSNVARGGYTFSMANADASTHVDALINKTAYKQSILFAWFGTNDLAQGAETAAQLEADAQTYVAARKAAGWDAVIVGTVLSRSDSNATQPNYETQREAYNTWLRANWQTFADGLFDPANDAIIGISGAETNRVYFNDDLVHLNNQGSALVAHYMRGALNSLGITAVSAPQVGMFVGAGDLHPLVGTPALTAHSNTMTMDFDASTAEQAWFSLMAPLNYDARWDVDLIWRATATTGASDWTLVLMQFDIAPPSGTAGTGNQGTANGVITATGNTNTVTGESINVLRLGTVSLSAGMVSSFRLARNAANADDTLTTDAEVVGLYFTPAYPYEY